jgi:hypothetical protein
MLENSATGSKSGRRFFTAPHLDNRVLRSSAQNKRHEEFAVTRNVLAIDKNENIVKRAKCLPEPCSCWPTDYGFAEFFGGGSEFLLFWKPTFSLIRLFEEEHE